MYTIIESLNNAQFTVDDITTLKLNIISRLRILYI